MMGIPEMIARTTTAGRLGRAVLVGAAFALSTSLAFGQQAAPAPDPFAAPVAPQAAAPAAPDPFASPVGGDNSSGPLASSAGCEADLSGLQTKYQAQVAILNKMVSKTKKLDPVTSCPKLKGLVAIDSQVVAYMKKNKTWCGIPDEMLGQIDTRRSKDASYATQACTIAEQVRKAQSQQAAGVGAPQPTRLPAGPL
jgi:hypothetical protein